jgi:threonine 3-dehydrogenase
MPFSALAPRFLGDGKIEFESHEYPDPGPGQLLLRIEANAICGTDRSQYFTGSDCVPGHEGAGIVLAAGDGTSTPAGTRGAVYLMDFCGVCRSCRVGHTNQCAEKRNDMGFTADGAYGPYEMVHESNFFPVPRDMSGIEATLLLDVMGTSGHALGRIGQMREDVESLYIGGAGPIGLGALAMAKLRYGAETPVYISDYSHWRLDFAASLGGLPVDLSRDGAIEKIKNIDAAIDATGKTVARRSALSLLGQRGVLVCLGHGESLTLSVSEDLIAPERTIMGSEYFRFAEMAGNLEILQANREYLRRIITHQVPRSEIVHAFELFLSGETGKVVVIADPA